MLSTLYAKLIGIGAILLLLLGAYLWVHHQGAVAQKAADDKTIAALRADLATAQGNAGACALALDKINATAAQARADAAASAQKAQQAMAKAQQDAATAERAAAAWQAKFRAAAASQGCASIKEQTVCPELFEPLPLH